MAGEGARQRRRRAVGPVDTGATQDGKNHA